MHYLLVVLSYRRRRRMRTRRRRMGIRRIRMGMRMRMRRMRMRLRRRLRRRRRSRMRRSRRGTSRKRRKRRRTRRISMRMRRGSKARSSCFYPKFVFADAVCFLHRLSVSPRFARNRQCPAELLQCRAERAVFSADKERQELAWVFYGSSQARRCMKVQKS